MSSLAFSIFNVVKYSIMVRPVLWCYSEEQEMQFLTDGRWKYIWFPRLGTEQLFHLAADPGEYQDLSGNPAYSVELDLWRKRLVQVLGPRNAGLTEGGRLVCQAGQPPLVSPCYKQRTEPAGV